MKQNYKDIELIPEECREAVISCLPLIADTKEYKKIIEGTESILYLFHVTNENIIHRIACTNIDVYGLINELYQKKILSKPVVCNRLATLKRALELIEKTKSFQASIDGKTLDEINPLELLEIYKSTTLNYLDFTYLYDRVNENQTVSFGEIIEAAKTQDPEKYEEAILEKYGITKREYIGSRPVIEAFLKSFIPLNKYCNKSSNLRLKQFNQILSWVIDLDSELYKKVLEHTEEVQTFYENLEPIIYEIAPYIEVATKNKDEIITARFLIKYYEIVGIPYNSFYTLCDQKQKEKPALKDACFWIKKPCSWLPRKESPKAIAPFNPNQALMMFDPSKKRPKESVNGINITEEHYQTCIEIYEEEGIPLIDSLVRNGAKHLALQDFDEYLEQIKAVKTKDKGKAKTK